MDFKMISKVLQAYRSVPSELWNWTTIAGLADCCCCCLEFFEQDSAQPGLPQSIQFALEGIAIVFKLSTRIRSLQNNKRTVIIKALDRLSFCAGRLPNVNRIDTAGFRRAVLLLGLGRDVARVLRLEKVTNVFNFAIWILRDSAVDRDVVIDALDFLCFCVLEQKRSLRPGDIAGIRQAILHLELPRDRRLNELNALRDFVAFY